MSKFVDACRVHIFVEAIEGYIYNIHIILTLFVKYNKVANIYLC